MSTTINIKALAIKSKEFQKHFETVKFCIERDLTFPIETSEFFKGKVDGHDLEELENDCIVDIIKNGVQIPMKVQESESGYMINVSDIPKEVDRIEIIWT